MTPTPETPTPDQQTDYKFMALQRATATAENYWFMTLQQARRDYRRARRYGDFASITCFALVCVIVWLVLK